MIITHLKLSLAGKYKQKLYHQQLTRTFSMMRSFHCIVFDRPCRVTKGYKMESRSS